MRNLRHARRLALLLVLVAAAGCGHGGGGGGNGGTTDFDAFVLDQIQNRTTDTAEPVEIADSQFSFPEDPSAFDVLFQ